MPDGCKRVDTVVVTVNPTITVNDITDQTVCNGGTTTAVTFSTNAPNEGTVTYSWTNNNTAIGLAASGTSDNIPAFTATNNTTESIVATITVTPTYTYGGKSCVGTEEVFTITVKDLPAVAVTAIRSMNIRLS